MPGTIYRKQLEYSTCAAVTLVIVVTYFFISCFIRTLVRKATGAERFVKASGRLSFLKNNRYFDTINVFSIILFVLFAGWAGFVHGVTGIRASWAWVFLFPCLLMFFFKMLAYI